MNNTACWNEHVSPLFYVFSGVLSYTVIYNLLNFPAGVVPVSTVTAEDEEKLRHYKGNYQDPWDKLFKQVKMCASERWQELDQISSMTSYNIQSYYSNNPLLNTVLWNYWFFLVINTLYSGSVWWAQHSSVSSLSKGLNMTLKERLESAVAAGIGCLFLPCVSNM